MQATDWQVSGLCCCNGCSNVFIELFILIFRIINATACPLIFVGVPGCPKELVSLMYTPVLGICGLVVQGAGESFFGGTHELLYGMVDFRWSGPVVLQFDGFVLSDLGSLFVPGEESV